VEKGMMVKWERISMRETFVIQGMRDKLSRQNLLRNYILSKSKYDTIKKII